MLGADTFPFSMGSLREQQLSPLQALLRPDQPRLTLSTQQPPLKTVSPAAADPATLGLKPDQSPSRSASSMYRQVRGAQREFSPRHFYQRRHLPTRPAHSSSSFCIQVASSDDDSASNDEGDESTASFAIRTPQDDAGISSVFLSSCS